MLVRCWASIAEWLINDELRFAKELFRLLKEFWWLTADAFGVLECKLFEMRELFYIENLKGVKEWELNDGPDERLD